MVLLTEAVNAAIGDPARKATFGKDTNGKPIKRQDNEVRKRIEPILPALPPDRRDVLLLQFDEIYDFIRRYRNDAGHPTGKVLEREEAFALLQLFPTYCVTAHTLTAWWAVNRI